MHTRAHSEFGARCHRSGEAVENTVVLRNQPAKEGASTSVAIDSPRSPFPSPLLVPHANEGTLDKL